MSAPARRRAEPPTLEEPGHGRRWAWELLSTNPMKPASSKKWFASLMSRSDSPLGYIGEYPSYGWGASIKTASKIRGKQFRPLPGAWTTPEAAAECLLRALREQRR